MKKQNFVPYGINIRYEIKTYKMIGTDYGDAKTANRGVWLNFLRFWRRVLNKKQKKYKICHTYSDWEQHVESVLNKNMLNYTDFLHWLYGKKTNAEEMLALIKVVLIPMYIAVFSISDKLWAKQLKDIPIEIGMTMVAIILVILSVNYFIDANEKVNFYKDIINVAEKR